MVTREEKIEALIDDIWNWDLGTVFGYLFSSLEDYYSDWTNTEIDEEYRKVFGNDL